MMQIVLVTQEKYKTWPIEFKVLHCLKNVLVFTCSYGTCILVGFIKCMQIIYTRRKNRIVLYIYRHIYTVHVRVCILCFTDWFIDISRKTNLNILDHDL